MVGDQRDLTMLYSHVAQRLHQADQAIEAELQDTSSIRAHIPLLLFICRDRPEVENVIRHMTASHHCPQKSRVILWIARMHAIRVFIDPGKAISGHHHNYWHSIAFQLPLNPRTESALISEDDPAALIFRRQGFHRLRWQRLLPGREVEPISHIAFALHRIIDESLYF